MSVSIVRGTFSSNWIVSMPLQECTAKEKMKSPGITLVFLFILSYFVSAQWSELVLGMIRFFILIGIVWNSPSNLNYCTIQRGRRDIGVDGGRGPRRHCNGQRSARYVRYIFFFLSYHTYCLAFTHTNRMMPIAHFQFGPTPPPPSDSSTRAASARGCSQGWAPFMTSLTHFAMLSRL